MLNLGKVVGEAIAQKRVEIEDAYTSLDIAEQAIARLKQPTQIAKRQAEADSARAQIAQLSEEIERLTSIFSRLQFRDSSAD